MARNKPTRKRSNKPDPPLMPTDPAENKSLQADEFLNLLRMLEEAGAPELVLQAAVNAQNAAADGNLQPLLDFFESIGLDPNQVAGGQDGDELGSPHDPRDLFPMSNLESATMLLADDSGDQRLDRTIQQAIKFFESVLAVDPESVEAMINLGIQSEDADAVKCFHKACEVAVKKLKQAGHLTDFWIDCRNQMGVDLVERARLADAIEILLPAIDEDEDDGAGTRFFLIDLMLRLGWWDELGELLDRFADDGMGPGIFAKAIRLHHLEPNSKEATEALRQAHEVKPLVAPVLISAVPLPAEFPNHYAVGSREESFVIARYLKPGLRANPGTIRWIRDTLNISADDQREIQGRREDTDEWRDIDSDENQSRPGDLHIAMDLPQTDETWTYHGQLVRDGNYVGLVFCGDKPVNFTSFDKAPRTRELRQFILDSVCEPVFGEPRRPAVVHVSTKATLKMLQKAVGTYGVACECVKPSALEKKAMKEIADQAQHGLEMAATSETFDRAALDIDRMPATDAPWLVAVLQPPIWIGDQSTPHRPFLQLVLDSENGTILKSEMTTTKPSAVQQVEVVASAMLRPMVGSSRCPSTIVVHPQLDHSAFDSAMQEITNSDCVKIVAGDDEIVSMFESLVVDMVRSNNPTSTVMIEQDGVDSEMLSRLYQAAARFYRVAPWNLVGGDQLVQASSGSTPGYQWGVGVMGQMGQAMGLSIIEGIDVAKSMIRGKCDMSCLSAISIQFDEAYDIPPLELWEIETQNHDIANEEAYPLFMRIKNGKAGHALSAGEIQTVIDLLNHLPAFLRLNRSEGSTTHGVAGTGSHLELQWISD